MLMEKGYIGATRDSEQRIMSQDYTYLQVPMSSTSQDVVTQVSMMSHVVKFKVKSPNLKSWHMMSHLS